MQVAWIVQYSVDYLNMWQVATSGLIGKGSHQRKDMGWAIMSGPVFCAVLLFFQFPVSSLRCGSDTVLVQCTRTSVTRLIIIIRLAPRESKDRPLALDRGETTTRESLTHCSSAITPASARSLGDEPTTSTRHWKRKFNQQPPIKYSSTLLYGLLGSYLSTSVEIRTWGTGDEPSPGHGTRSAGEEPAERLRL